MNDSVENRDIKTKILIAAGKKFAEKGFADTTVREICDVAGANLAAVNYYFGDKENLYIEAVKFARKNRVDENPLPEGDSDPETRLRSFISTMVKRTGGINSPSWQLQLLMRELLFPTEACQRLIDEYFRPSFSQLLEIIQEFSPRPLEEQQAYRLGYSIIGQVMYLRFTSKMKSMFLPEKMLEDHFQIEQIAEHIYQFSIAALKSEEFWNLIDRDSESNESNEIRWA